jgi:hypothetical protein
VPSTSRGRRGRAATLATCLLAVGSAGLIGVALAGQQSVPAPALSSEPRPLAPEVPSASSAPGGVPGETPMSGPVLAAARPVDVRIPAIGVAAPQIVALGLDSAGAMEVPTDFDAVGWYRHSPSPGELGPAVLAGHVDSREGGPAVFFRLAELTPGDEVRVGRSDGTTAVFVVERVERYAKHAFPTLQVYGDLDHAGLRLITCGGRFDRSTGHYEDNVVAYARLVGQV